MPIENETSAQHRRRLPLAAIVGFISAAASMAVCWAFAGAGIGQYFGGIVFASLLLPALVLSEEGLLRRSIVAVAVCDGIAIVWLAGIGFSPVTLVQWLLCYAVLIVWTFALFGMSLLAGRIFSSVPASAMVVVLAMSWLSSPIWLSRYLLDHQNLTAYIVGPHPLFAINGILKTQGIWGERPIAYRFLFTLGQDVPYELPRSIAPMAVVHLLVGGVTLIASRLGRR